MDKISEVNNESAISLLANAERIFEPLQKAYNEIVIREDREKLENELREQTHE